ncbi:MAG: DUF983 domain-containing protein [Bacteroidetes bacterium]|nr:DUF983 domain-containing protein [Bacteroidota bacterium]
MKIIELIYSVTTNKCPRCHKGKVFKNNNPYAIKQPLKMNDSCSVCNLKYEKEPGFFYGAMYASYAITSGLFIMWFVADLIWLHLAPLKLFVYVSLTLILGFPLIFTWARLLWLNLFNKYDKKY